MTINNLSLLGDVARLLACKPYRVVYLLSSGKVAEPALRLGNRRVFTKDDIARIAAKLTLTKKEKQMSDSEFLTMKEIGKVFGVTSHVIGRKLKELGLRTADGKPTYKAFQGGYCKQRWTDDMAHYCWAWHAEKTIRLLKEHFGSEQAPCQESDPEQVSESCPDGVVGNVEVTAA
jgi:hypothetical protein